MGSLHIIKMPELTSNENRWQAISMTHVEYVKGNGESRMYYSKYDILIDLL